MSSSGQASLLKLIRGSFAYGLLPLVGLVTAPLLARVLGPTGRGQLAAVLQPLTVIEHVLVAGLPTAITYFVGRGLLFKSISKQVLIVTGCTSVLTFAIVAIYSRHIAEATGLNHLFVVGVWYTCLIPLVLSIRRAVIQGRGRLGLIDLERVFIALLRLGSVIVLFWLGVNAVEPYVIAALFPGFIAAAVLFLPWGLNRQAKTTPMQTEQSISNKRFYSYVVLAGSGQIAIILNARVDQALLPLVLQSGQLGLFSVAVTIAEIPLILSTVTARNLLSEASRGTTTPALLKTALIGTTLIAMISTLLWFITPWATTLIFGADFASAAEIARILLLGNIFSSMTASAGVILAGTGRPGRAIISPLTGVITFTLGIFLLGETINLKSAAVLVLICRITSSIFGIVILSLSIRPIEGTHQNAEP